MPSSPNYKRDYKRERQLQSTPEEMAKNASRKAARRKLEVAGVVSPNDGKDVDHKNRNPRDNSMSNLAAEPKSANRSFSRKANASKYNKGGYVACGASNPGTQRKK